MARQHDYRYEYKKQNYLQLPEYTTDIPLRIYVRYSETNIPHILDFEKIHEEYYCAESSYVIGDVTLADAAPQARAAQRPRCLHGQHSALLPEQLTLRGQRGADTSRL